MPKDKEALLKKAFLILYDNGLSSDDMKLWESRLRDSSADAISLFIDTFENDKELLEMATDNLKKKIEAIKNPEKIQDVVQEEKDTLQRYLNE